MNFLFISSKSTFYDIPWVLKDLGHFVEDMDDHKFDPLHKNPISASHLFERLSKKDTHFDFVISYFFMPEVSDICSDFNIPYISYIFDSPLMSLYTKSIFNNCNRIFVFDKSEYNHLKSIGVKHLYNFTLATNIHRTGNISISKNDIKKYSCDISFIGNLYENNNYNEVIQGLPDHISFQLKSYLIKNLCKWDEIRPWPIVSDQCLDHYIQHFKNLNIPELMDPKLYLGIFILSRKLAEMDRLTALNAISEINNIDLYTNSISPHLNNISCHAPVDYYTDMNKIFHLSKINVNITLPSIVTGIPLRAFDIMGMGGFLLTNHQDEILEHFSPGKDLETFKTIEELKEKISYYLKNEEQRKTIAINGYLRVKEKHTYHIQMENMLKILTKEKDQ